MEIGVVVPVQAVVLVDVPKVMVIVLAKKVTLETNVTNIVQAAVMDADNLMEHVTHVKLVTMGTHVNTVVVPIVLIDCVIRILEIAMLVSLAIMGICAKSHALQSVRMTFVYKSLALAVKAVT